MLASGPGIPSAAVPAEPHALDLAPTILSVMNMPVPSYMPGKPLFPMSPAVQPVLPDVRSAAVGEEL